MNKKRRKRIQARHKRIVGPVRDIPFGKQAAPLNCGHLIIIDKARGPKPPFKCAACDKPGGSSPVIEEEPVPC